MLLQTSGWVPADPDLSLDPKSADFSRLNTEKILIKADNNQPASF